MLSYTGSLFHFQDQTGVQPLASAESDGQMRECLAGESAEQQERSQHSAAPKSSMVYVFLGGGAASDVTVLEVEFM